MLDARRLAAAEVVIARRIVRLAIKRIDPDARPEMRHVERVLSCVAEGAGSVTLPAGIDARVEFGMLAFKAPAAREGLVADWISVPGRLRACCCRRGCGLGGCGGPGVRRPR